MLKRWALALSLANLCFVDVWAKLLPGSGYHYYLAAPPAPINFVVAWSGVLLLTAALRAMMVAGRRLLGPRAAPAGGWAAAILLLVIVNALRRQTPQLSTAQLADRLGAALAHVALIAAACAAGLALIRFRRHVPWLAERALLVLVPFAPITLAQSIAAVASPPSLSHPPAGTAPPPAGTRATPGPRLLWLHFDGLDHRLAFAERPPGLRLPALDLLGRESLMLADARPPSLSTTLAIPALTTGRVVTAALPTAAGELSITFAGRRAAVPWSREPNVFSRTRQLGVVSALVGYFHPYCRLFGPELAACVSHVSTALLKLGDADSSPGEVALFQLHDLLGIFPGASRWAPGLTDARLTRRAERRALVRIYRRMVEDVDVAVGDRRVGFVFVHWPIPHEPGIYDRARERLTESLAATYLDNLELVDRTVAAVRRRLDASGLARDTAILLTADHAWRDAAAFDGTSDVRVPLLLMLPGGGPGTVYPVPVCSVVVSDLALAVLKGEIRTYAETARWLDGHPATLPVSTPRALCPGAAGAAAPDPPGRH